MLLRFGVENHLSIRDRQELILTAAKRVKRSGPVAPVPILGEAAVPVAVLYGANASGKSNLIDALQIMHSHIVLSHKSRDAGDDIPRRPFLLDEGSKKRPTRFDCLFTIESPDASARQEVYEYGFSCTDTEFTNEWLHRLVRHKRQATQMLFERATRDGELRVKSGGHLRGEIRAIVALTRPNSLFLSAAAQNNHPQLSAIHRQFLAPWQIGPGEGSEMGIAKALDQFEQQGAFMELIRQADLGVVDKKLEDYEASEAERKRFGELRQAIANLTGSPADVDGPTLPEKRLRFTHASDAGPRPIDYNMESRGTQRLAALAIPVLKAISAGQLVVADELDASLHHRLTAAVLGLFKGATNRHGAQLIATVHNTALLRDGLQLDEVWLAEKDAAGVSRYTPLTDYHIRSRDDLERLYRDGRLGGAPVVGDLALALDD